MNNTIKAVPYSTTNVASASQPVAVAGVSRPPGSATQARKVDRWRTR